MRVTVLRGVFISSFGTFCVNVAGGPAGGWLLMHPIFFSRSSARGLVVVTGVVSAASPPP